MRPTFALLTIACWLAAAAAIADPLTERYQSLLAAAEGDPAKADWGALRTTYAATPQFNVFGDPGAKHRLYGALQNGDDVGALRIADQILADDYVDMDAHNVAAQADAKLGRTREAAKHAAIARALAASVETGDGLSPAGAFTVISVEEEYALMRLLNLKVVNMVTGHAGPHHYDALDAVDAMGVKRTYFFLIDAVLAAEAAASEDKVPQPVQTR